MTYHRYSPMGRLQTMRALTLLGPLLTILALAPAHMGPTPLYAAINPAHRALATWVVLCWLATVLWLSVVRITVSGTTEQSTRVVALHVSFVLVLVTNLASVSYSMTGASPAWGVAGYVLAVTAIVLLPFSRYAHDVSGEIT